VQQLAGHLPGVVGDALEERLMPALLGAGTRDDILAGADRFAPDVVVVDCMMDAGLEAAHMLGLPSAVLVHLRRFADVIAGLGGGDTAAQKVIRLAGARARDRALFTA
jgi:hypothetical protein